MAVRRLRLPRCGCVALWPCAAPKSIRAVRLTRAQDPSLEAKMRDVQARLAKERKFLEGFRTMKAATRNVDVQKSCDAKIEQAVKTIGYFEESLRELSQRQASPLGSSASLSNLGGSGGAAGASGMDPRANAAGGRSGDPRLSASSATGGPSYSNRALPLPPGQQPRPDSGLSMNSGGSSLAPQRKAQYTNLGPSRDRVHARSRPCRPRQGRHSAHAG